MKTKNYLALTESLNKFRMEHQSKTYTREELVEALCGLGFNKGTASMVIAKCVPSEKMGTSKLYSFGREPIHKSQVETIYKKFASYGNTAPKKPVSVPVSEEESLISKMKEMGYQARKIVGFDMERFKAENPVLYKKYLKYETV
jgi:Holliday junction resolvasome RuvABC DNA-binding subunit